MYYELRRKSYKQFVVNKVRFLVVDIANKLEHFVSILKILFDYFH